MLCISLKSNKSNKNLIFSSALESANMIIPENSSNASISPLWSVSKTLKVLSVNENICSNSVKLILNASQTLVKPP